MTEPEPDTDEQPPEHPGFTVTDLGFAVDTPGLTFGLSAAHPRACAPMAEPSDP